MDQTFDAILLLVSGAAGLYCFILSRRLKALQDMKTGIGASILAMTNAIAQLNAASHDSKQQTAMAKPAQIIIARGRSEDHPYARLNPSPRAKIKTDQSRSA